MTELLDLLRCPACGGTLARRDGSLVCEARHAYDLARAGYVNLLPPGKMKNARAGDEAVMVRARTAFLSLGRYDPIDEALADALCRLLPDGEAVVVDMGAGEGWHTCRTAELLFEKRAAPVLALGFDASKYAAERGCALARARGHFSRGALGSPREGDVTVACLPGNIFHLPVADACASAALSLFAPVPWAEAARVLAPGGILAVVSAGRDHLIELRRELYDEVRTTEYLPAPPEDSPLKLLERVPLAFSFAAESREELENLFVMTPFYHKTGEDGRRRLAQRDGMRLTASVNLSLFVLRGVTCSSAS